jgi:outer membrane lipoprotein SlyB
MKTPLTLAIASVLLLTSAGCLSNSKQPVYTKGQANQSMRIETGTVLGVRQVVIDGESTQVGIWGGGMIGGAAASSIGQGTGAAVAGAVGATAGMVVGREVEKVATRKDGLLITIAMDNGETIAIVQEESKGGFEDGDRVQVMIGHDTAIVMH